MSRRNHAWGAVGILCFGLAGLCLGQEASRKAPSPTAQDAATGKGAAVMSPEEKLVRATYEKLTKLNKAARLSYRGAAGESPDGSQVLRFELSNFRVGPIQEIWGALQRDLMTLPSGEIITLSRSITTLNKGPEHVAYEAEWAQGQYASSYDPQWTVGDMFGIDPARYHDVGGYASYVVTVSFRGQSRTYRALALFHNPYRSAEALKPDFWDAVVGMGGTLTLAWDEKRPPLDESVSPPAQRDGPSDAPGVSPPKESPPQDDQLVYATEEYSALGSTGNYVESTTQDSRDHYSGAHGQTVGFQGVCSEQPNNEQLCRVETVYTLTFENGKTTNWFYKHVNRTDAKQDTSTGPRGTEITCTAARGVATRNCLDSTCSFSVSLQGSGTSVTMTGGDVWNGQLAHRHTCKLPSTSAGGGCTTAGWNGSCPPGYYPDGSGMCCSGGGDCGLAAATDAPSAAVAEGDSVSANIAPGGGGGGCGCDEVARMDCFNGGGEWSETYCSCISPIVVDVLGDGFELTDGAGGVDFDFTGDGTPERLAWTAAGSDDAWLFLDRDGDGVVDGGQELFGSHTPQPAPPTGEQRNGFLALAIYDRPGNGGNADGAIDWRDAVYPSLRLWQDTNHNGISEPGELHTLAEFGIERLHLKYHVSKRADRHGNRFRYRAKVDDARGTNAGRWAWDVFPVKPQ